MQARVTKEQVRRAPKVLLHDHLDGGLRPATIVELAAEVGHQLPATDADVAGPLVHRGGRLRLAGALPGDLRPHRRGHADRRRADRVARECVEDLAADGVVYAEVRFAPEQHVERGLTLDEVVEAVLAGFEEGMAAQPAAGSRTAAAHRDAAPGPVQGDRRARRSPTATAGSSASTSPAPRPGYPPTRHLDAFEYLQRENSHFTIHAGEAFGLPSIWEAIQWCGADRLGHGVRIIDDITVDRRRRRSSSAGWRRTSGTSGSRWRCARPPTCRPAPPTSIAEHPIGLLRRLRFRVTVNTDNRLMCGTSMTAEMTALVEAFGYGCATCSGSPSTR